MTTFIGYVPPDRPVVYWREATGNVLNPTWEILHFQFDECWGLADDHAFCLRASGNLFLTEWALMEAMPITAKIDGGGLPPNVATWVPWLPTGTIRVMGGSVIATSWAEAEAEVGRRGLGEKVMGKAVEMLRG